MPSAVECRVEGLDEIENCLLELTTKKARAGMREGLGDAGEFMRVSMALEAPSATGQTAREMQSKVTLSGKNDEGIVAVGPSKQTYWDQFVEFGSIHNRPPNPFIRRSFEKYGQKMLEVFTNKMRDILGL
jgi:HK97 gp10 family phage protein